MDETRWEGVYYKLNRSFFLSPPPLPSVIAQIWIKLAWLSSSYLGIKSWQEIKYLVTRMIHFRMIEREILRFFSGIIINMNWSWYNKRMLYQSFIAYENNYCCVYSKSYRKSVIYFANIFFLFFSLRKKHPLRMIYELIMI